ncbi:MAG: NAD(P)H-dependent oxidoreductase subunit E [Bacteroidales bacterium]
MHTTRQILCKYPPDRQKLINILHEIQDANEYNYITENDMQQVADFFNTTKASIYGVVTYYTMLSTKPRGKNLIRVCKSPVCHISGAFSLIEMLKNELGLDHVGETSKDKMFTLEYSECLGQCAMAPGILINKDFYGRLDKEKLKEILSYYKNESPSS